MGLVEEPGLKVLRSLNSSPSHSLTLNSQLPNATNESTENPVRKSYDIHVHTQNLKKNRTIQEADWISLPWDKIKKRKDEQRSRIVLTETWGDQLKVKGIWELKKNRNWENGEVFESWPSFFNSVFFTSSMDGFYFFVDPSSKRKENREKFSNFSSQIL